MNCWLCDRLRDCMAAGIVVDATTDDEEVWGLKTFVPVGKCEREGANDESSEF